DGKVDEPEENGRDINRHHHRYRIGIVSAAPAPGAAEPSGSSDHRDLYDPLNDLRHHVDGHSDAEHDHHGTDQDPDFLLEDFPRAGEDFARFNLRGDACGAVFHQLFPAEAAPLGRPLDLRPAHGTGPGLVG